MKPFKKEKRRNHPFTDQSRRSVLFLRLSLDAGIERGAQFRGSILIIFHGDERELLGLKVCVARYGVSDASAWLG